MKVVGNKGSIGGNFIEIFYFFLIRLLFVNFKREGEG